MALYHEPDAIAYPLHTHPHVTHNPVSVRAIRPDCCGPRLGFCCCCSLCGFRPWRLFTSCCPPIKESKSTKCFYSLFVVASSALMSAMTMPQIQDYLKRLFRDFSATCTDLKIGHNCLQLTGYMAAYKVSFSFCFLFIALSLLTIGVTTGKGARSYIHNGLWLLKIIFVLAIMVTMFVVPVSHLDELHSAWIYTSLVGNWLFMIVQIVALIDVTDAICSRLRRMSQSKKFWWIVETSISIIVVTIWLIMSIVLFLSHGQQEYCLTKQLILISSTGFCICILLTSLTPCARRPSEPYDTNPDSVPGSFVHSWKDQRSWYASQLIQAGLVVVYISFWTWSAMQSTPQTPGFLELALLVDENDLICIVPKNEFVEQSLTYTSIVMMFLTLTYIASSQTEVRDLPKSNEEQECYCLRPNAMVTPPQVRQHSEVPTSYHHFKMQPKTNSGKIIKDESVRTTYSYSLFHLFVTLATMFSTTQLTRWFQPDHYKLLDLDRSWQTVGLKIASAWSCGLLYLLYLLLPVSWVSRFKHNSRQEQRQTNPLEREHRQSQQNFYSSQFEMSERFQPSSSSLLTHM